MNERQLHLVGKEQVDGAGPGPSGQEPELWYAGLPMDTVHALEQRVQRINAVVTQSVLDIGRELIEARKEIQAFKAGGFQAWVRARVGMSEQHAYRLMAVAEQFGESNIMLLSHFAQTALLLLSAPSVPQEIRDEALSRAEDGEKITVQRAKDLIDAQRGQRRAEEEAQAASAEAQRLRQQVEQHEAEARETIAALTRQILALQEAMASRPELEAQVREVEVVPSAVTATMEQLQAQVRELTDQRDRLSVKAQQLGEDLVALREATQVEREQEMRGVRLRHRFDEVTRAFHRQMIQLMSQLPSPLETQEFATDEWNRLAEVEEDAHRVLAACRRLRDVPRVVVVEAEETIPEAEQEAGSHTKS